MDAARSYWSENLAHLPRGAPTTSMRRLSVREKTHVERISEGISSSPPTPCEGGGASIGSSTFPLLTEHPIVAPPSPTDSPRLNLENNTEGASGDLASPSLFTTTPRSQKGRGTGWPWVTLTPLLVSPACGAGGTGRDLVPRSRTRVLAGAEPLQKRRVRRNRRNSETALLGKRHADYLCLVNRASSSGTSTGKDSPMIP